MEVSQNGWFKNLEGKIPLKLGFVGVHPFRKPPYSILLYTSVSFGCKIEIAWPSVLCSLDPAGATRSRGSHWSQSPDLKATQHFGGFLMAGGTPKSSQKKMFIVQIPALSETPHVSTPGFMWNPASHQQRHWRWSTYYGNGLLAIYRSPGWPHDTASQARTNCFSPILRCSCWISSSMSMFPKTWNTPLGITQKKMCHWESRDFGVHLHFGKLTKPLCLSLHVRRWRPSRQPPNSVWPLFRGTSGSMTNQSRTEFPNLPGRFTGRLGGTTPLMGSFSNRHWTAKRITKSFTRCLIFPCVSHSLLIEVQVFAL